jgi:hypothetical protein
MAGLKIGSVPRVSEKIRMEVKMKNFEKYLEIKAKVKEFQSKIVALEEEVRNEQKILQSSRDEKTKKVLISGQDPGQIVNEASKVKNLKKGIDTIKHAIKILEEELDALRPIAFADLKTKFREPYEKVVRAFWERLKEAERAERKILDLKEEARPLTLKIDLSSQYPIVPSLNLVTIEEYGESEKSSPIARFKEDCKRAGINLD